MNRLQYETSPYLLQHADNPVDWYAWGDDAFAAARAEDKPILLSIGYSACHWCHVMEHESFEDDETAGLMNRLFVNIKVDREERPDVDDVYMQATLMFTGGHGGWPMTVFMTPDGRPFHAGTYFPPEPRYGMPSFRQVLMAASDAYHNRRGQLEEAANEVTASLQRVGFAVPKGQGGIELDEALLRHTAQKLIAQADPIYGGLHRGQPKFPQPMTLEYLLQYNAYDEDNAAVLKTVLFTLRKMAQGGIYDQLGGGFHRYSVDEKWLVPHFEKMLYDNAQLARVYLHAYQVSGDEFFAAITHEILTYVGREMLDASGGFYSTQDADSEGEEGRFFVWSATEVQTLLQDALTPELLGPVMAYFNITQRGNFEGRNILNISHRLEDVAAASGVDDEELQQAVQRARAILFEAREARIKPGRDEKMLAAWNGMMLAAFAEAARVLGVDTYRQIAESNARFLLNELSMADGRLYRTHKRMAEGSGQSKLNGYLEDYACVIDGLIELYQTSFDPHWFGHAERLAEHVLAHFADPAGGFFDTSDDHETLIARPRNAQDNATPAGSNLMAYNLLKLAAYTGNVAYENAAVGVLNQVTAAMREYPSAFGMALSGVNLLVSRPIEVAIIGEPSEPATSELLAVVQKGYRPTVVTALSPIDQGEKAVPPVLAHRVRRNDLPTVYVCQNFVCDVPVNSVDALEKVLAKTTL